MTVCCLRLTLKGVLNAFVAASVNKCLFTISFCGVYEASAFNRIINAIIVIVQLRVKCFQFIFDRFCIRFAQR